MRLSVSLKRSGKAGKARLRMKTFTGAATDADKLKITCLPEEGAVTVPVWGCRAASPNAPGARVPPGRVRACETRVSVLSSWRL